MTTHGILIPLQIAATNVDSYNRSAVTTATDVDNGNIVKLTTYGVASGNAEVWTGVTPSSSAGLTNLWMVYDPELVWTGSYRGLDPDVRNFYVAATRVFSVFSPQLGDILRMTADNLVTGTGAAIGSFAIATDTTGGLKPVWTSGWTSGTAVFAMKCIKANSYISIGTGAIDTQRIASYDFEVVHL
jgi:hypothetical protein